MSDRCRFCPVPADRPCKGVEVRRYCELLDPACPQHDPAYARLLREFSYPPAARQAANLARSLWDWAVSGFGMASDEEAARRLAICAACPNWDAAQGRCMLCGCFAAAKARLRTEKCPAGLW